MIALQLFGLMMATMVVLWALCFMMLVCWHAAWELLK